MENYRKISGKDEYVSFQSKEKIFSDHIFNNSRSMISIINRDYIYEKVNSTFCEAGKRYYEVIFRPFPVESGEISRLLAETFDITDLKLLEKNAIEKEEKLVDSGIIKQHLIKTVSLREIKNAIQLSIN